MNGEEINTSVIMLAHLKVTKLLVTPLQFMTVMELDFYC